MPNLLELFEVQNERASGAGTSISGEAHTIGEDVANEVWLNEVPDEGVGVTISGFTEIASGSPNAGEFLVTYTDRLRGRVLFNAADDGTEITVDYTGLGTGVTARDVNRVADYFKALGFFPRECDPTGSVECTDALNAMIDRAEAATDRPPVCWMMGTYKVGGGKSLHLDGNVSLIWLPGSKIVLDGGETNGGRVIGVPIGRNAKWTGRWIGGIIEKGANWPGEWVSNVFNAEDYLIDGLIFKGFDDGLTSGSLMKGQNHASWRSDPSVRKNGTYRDLRSVNCSNGGEGVSVANVATGSYAENMIFERLRMGGMGDDPLALHGVTGFEIRGGFFRAQDGRIFISDSIDGIIDSPNIQHTSAGGGQAFVELAYESSTAGTYRSCEDIQILNLQAKILSGQSIAQPIHLRGARDVQVLGGHIVNLSGNVARIMMTGQTHDSVLRPFGRITVGGDITLEDVEVRVDPGAGERDAWVKIGRLMQDGKGTMENGILFTDFGDFDGDEMHAVPTLGAGGSAGARLQGEVQAAQFIGAWTANHSEPQTTLNLFGTQGIHNFPFDQVGFIPCYLKVIIEKTTSTGTFDLQMEKNDGNHHIFTIDVADGNEQTLWNPNTGPNEISQDPYAAGDNVGFNIANGTDIEGDDVTVLLFGIMADG